MTSPIGVRAAQDSLVASVKTLEKANTTIQFKTRWLKQHRSSDAIQQMQTDAIIDLADAVQQIQLAMSALPLMLPDVSGARAAAEAAAAAAAAAHLKTSVGTTPYKRL